MAFASPESWHQIRGAQMLLSMKVISLSFDIDHEVHQMNMAKKDDDLKVKEEEETKKTRHNRRNRLNAPKSDEVETDGFKLDLTKVPNVLEYIGYALCPGNSVFGPWIKFKDYMKAFYQPRWVI